MNWQQQLLAKIAAAAPNDADLAIHGSAGTPETLDGWSDLDLALRLTSDADVGELVPVAVWAVEDVRHPEGQTCRTVLADGHRLDLSITGPGRLTGFLPDPDNEVRFLAALATAKLGRGDRLIGMHLTLELWKRCLEEAMQLRDRAVGTTIHRHGTDHDQLAEQIRQLAAEPADLADRPTIVERTVDLYAGWRGERVTDYRPDWEPLHALTDLGLSGTPPTDQ